MCLYNTLGKPEKTSGIGYKIYTKSGDTIYTSIRSLKGDRIWSQGDPLEFNKKYLSVRKCIEADNGKRYLSGFHIFERLKDARDWANETAYRGDVVVKVQYRKARLRGTQVILKQRRNRPCIIADEVTLLEVIK